MSLAYLAEGNTRIWGISLVAHISKELKDPNVASFTQLWFFSIELPSYALNYFDNLVLELRLNKTNLPTFSG